MGGGDAVLAIAPVVGRVPRDALRRSVEHRLPVARIHANLRDRGRPLRIRGERVATRPFEHPSRRLAVEVRIQLTPGSQAERNRAQSVREAHAVGDDAVNCGFATKCGQRADLQRA